MHRPALALAVALLLPAASAAAAPPNDNYLASTTINQADGSMPGDYRDRQDTSTATTQADTFEPDKNGVSLGGGPPEKTTCGPASYGKTVWYDFVPPAPGGVRIVAAGFDAVVAVYEWDPQTSKITKLVLCHNTSSGATEEVLMQRQIRRGGSYTVQVGGVNNAGGLLDFQLTYFPDSDGDGVVDEAPDRCRTTPGPESLNGCPPLARGTPRVLFDRVGGALKITSLVVDKLDKGARISARCRRCGGATARTARRKGSLSVRGFVGRTLRPGDFIEVRITQPRSGTGRFRYGAVGHVYRYPVKAGGLGVRTDHCLAPGSRSTRVACP